MEPKIKLGIIGCGKAAEFIYVPALKTFSHIEITGVVDPIKDRSELISKMFLGCKHYSSINSEFINQIDAAIICTPPDTHVNQASELLYKNKYVLVEKPLALTLVEINKLTEVESSSQAALMMAFNHRYWRPAIDLKEKTKDAQIHFVEMVFTGNYKMWNPVSFKSDPINDLGPHVFDLMKFIFNEDIFSVAVKSIESNIIDLKIKMKENLLINCQIGHTDRTEKTIKIISEKENYFIILSSERLTPEPGMKRNCLDAFDKIKRKIMGRVSPIKKTYLYQLNTFFDLIKSKETEVAGIKDGISAIKAIGAVTESIKQNGKEVFLK